MNKIFLVIIVLLMVSCGNSNEITELKQSQKELEARIDKLEKDMEQQMKIDSILLEFQKPLPGSLLYELEQQKNK